MDLDGTFESLPVELIADILSELDLSTLVTVSNVSPRLRAISSEPSLNPWRRPIFRTLHSTDGEYDPCLKTLSVRSTVPRQNFVEILSLARANYLLFEASLPNLKDRDWEECFSRRFPPSWVKVRKDGTWKEAFMKVLYRVWHRSNTFCTSDEAWTKYVTLNRNGTANQLESASHGYNPLTIFEEVRLQNDLLHLPPSIRVLVQFADVRILAIGVLNKPRSTFGVNANARALLHPPGIDKDDAPAPSDEDESPHASENEIDSEPGHSSSVPVRRKKKAADDIYRRLVHPLPVPAHENYPFYTPGGGDQRWITAGEVEEGGLQWVGCMMIVAQLTNSRTMETTFDEAPFIDTVLVEGPGRSQYASFTFEDLNAIAPWLEAKQIIGPSLGHGD